MRRSTKSNSKQTAVWTIWRFFVSRLPTSAHQRRDFARLPVLDGKASPISANKEATMSAFMETIYRYSPAVTSQEAHRRWDLRMYAAFRNLEPRRVIGN